MRIKKSMSLILEDENKNCYGCEHFHKCFNREGLINVTSSDDIIKDMIAGCHYINRPGYDYPKEEEK